MINIKEYNAILSLASDKRMRYLIKRVADTQVIYSLGYDNFDLEIFEVKGRKYIPLWPYPEFVEGYKKEVPDLEDLLPLKIDIYEFEKSYRDSFKKNNVEFFDVFPINELTANIIGVDAFFDILNEELSEYY